MASGIRNVAADIILWAYSKVFQKEAGPVTRNFIRNVGYIFIGLFIAKAFSLFFQIYVGRSIGAEEYGKYALIFSISQFLWVPMLMAIGTATVTYLASEKADDKRKEIVSTSVTMVIAFSAFFSLLFYATADLIAAPLSVSVSYVHAAIVVALLYAVWVYSQEILKGLGRMKTISVMNVVYSAVIVSVAVILIYYGSTGSVVPVAAICIGYVISSFMLLPALYRFFRPGMERMWAKKFLHYGSIAVFAILASSFVSNINQILLNKFMDTGSVGLYQAYYLSTIAVMTFLVNILLTVFFPESSRYENKAVIFRQIKKLFILTPAIFAVIGCASYVIVTMYGSGYALMPDMVLLFALSSVLIFMYSIYNVFSSSLGIGGIKITTISIIAVSLVGVTSSFILIPIMQIRGAAVSLALSHAVGIVLIYFVLSRYLGGKADVPAKNAAKGR
jgi:O-antigen/teichoic acid export membrane protein